MKFQSQSKNITDYLRRTDIIDFDDSGIAELAGHFRIASDSETELIRRTYEFVRDEIFHSADIDGQVVTCKASDVLDKKEGICFAKKLSSNSNFSILQVSQHSCGHGEMYHSDAVFWVSFVIFRVAAVL